MAKKIFTPGEPYYFSRSKAYLFLECPRCFYLDHIRGIVRPPSFPLSLNNAVDKLMKAEFDTYRQWQQPHPVVVQNGLNLIPYQHHFLSDWRDSFKGIRAEYAGHRFGGIIDDVWVDANGVLYIVDYKATVKPHPIENFHLMEKGYYRSYFFQLEFYQWLFDKNGFGVSNTAYFVFANGKDDLPQFNNQLQFNLQLIKYEGNPDRLEPILDQMLQCLLSTKLPDADKDCVFCKYATKTANIPPY
jgi:hypothetical protein